MTNKLVSKNNKLLRTPCERFDFSNPQMNPVELYNELGDELLKHKGLGLAANQIGHPYRVFVIWSDPIKPFFNPIIVDTSDEEVTLEESCLSFPGIVVKRTRPRIVKIRYADPTGEIFTDKFQDMTARVVQHEIEHLDGNLFTSQVPRLELELAIKKAKKHGFNYVINDLR